MAGRSMTCVSHRRSAIWGSSRRVTLDAGGTCEQRVAEAVFRFLWCVTGGGLGDRLVGEDADSCVGCWYPMVYQRGVFEKILGAWRGMNRWEEGGV